MNSERLDSREEHGAVIILVAMLAFVLLMFATLVIDLTQFEDAREQSEYYARKAVLAALAAHLASDASTTSAKTAEALARAREVAGKNFLLSDGPSRAAQMDLTSGNGAELVPGIYYFQKPCNDPANPKCDPTGGVYPKFVPWTSAQGEDAKITAYKITGKLYEGISTKFARSIFGVNEFPVDVLATASVYPRQGCFLVDVSGSMTQETHITKTGTNDRTAADQTADPQSGYGRYFAFTTSADNAGSSYTRQDNHWTLLQNGPVRPTTAALWNTFLSPATTADVSAAEYERMHFRDDYRLFETLGNADYPNLSAELKKLHPDPATLPAARPFNPYFTRVDSYRTSATPDATFPSYSYDGAEPLRTVFRGLKKAMEEFKERQVAGDAACLILYDRSLRFYRYVKLTSNFDYIISLTDFDDLSTLTTAPQGDIDVVARLNADSARGFEKLVRYGMMPMGEDGGYTNTLLAVSQAMNELQSGNPEGGFANNFITILGDGLSNCEPCTSGGSCVNSYQCFNNFTTFNNAQNQLLNLVRTSVQARNIPIHWVLVGESVAPHTLAIKNGTGTGAGKCMTDQDARRFTAPGMAGVPMVRGGFGHVESNGNIVVDHDSCKNACSSPTSADCVACSAAFRDMSPEKPFLDSNLVPYELAASTKGLWGPIRKTRPGCVPLDMDNGCTTPPTSWQTAPVLTQDPACRDENQQMEDYMLEIIGGNPISLVEAQ